MLLKKKGIAALTQPQVARAAGIKQSHLTYYFPTRADLLLGIAGQTIAQTVEEVAARLRESPDPATLADTCAKAMIGGVPPRAMIGLIVAADADPAIRKPLRRLIKHVRIQVQALLATSGLASGKDSALLFHATVVGLAIMHQARLNAQSASEVRSGISAMLSLLAQTSENCERGKT